ncbi:hypothetical protein [Eptesicus fuscus gammaherpesvirus]|uniref:Uncharacterized protein n=1 Tax=vespertilionid gammaherpesvirus 3 TaxID=2846598 RepID=A0A2D0ZPI5_9GAMA|nr:hypothetical protein [Eptesicus fuscus gammaherpesvirus]ATA58256.1 hypothetical protein [Eptesicus fuscus gammaherpesvirus]WAH70944.1 0RF27 [Eptesicus fuscus gammaherpesvirus]
MVFISNLLSVGRLDDGSVRELHAGPGGSVTEKVHGAAGYTQDQTASPYRSTTEPLLGRESNGGGVCGGEGSREAGGCGSGSRGSKRALLESKVSCGWGAEKPTPGHPKNSCCLRATVCALCYLLYGLAALAIVVATHPFFADRRPSVGRDGHALPLELALLPLAPAHPGCHDAIFCDPEIAPPVIETPVGVFYPNFTNDAGRPADYGAAVAAAYSVLSNASCDVDVLEGAYGLAYRLVSSGVATDDPEDSDVYATVQDFRGQARIRLLLGLFVLQQDCHPEALFGVLNPHIVRAHSGIDPISLARTPAPGPCDPGWGRIYNLTRAPARILSPTCLTSSRPGLSQKHVTRARPGARNAELPFTIKF